MAKALCRCADAVFGAQLVPVMVMPDRANAVACASDSDTIEIELPGGYRVRVGSSVKFASLRLVLNALERR